MHDHAESHTNYMVWEVTEQRVYQSRVNIVDELKECLMQYGPISNIIDSATDQWKKRLHACVHANGGHFEHLL